MEHISKFGESEIKRYTNILRRYAHEKYSEASTGESAYKWLEIIQLINELNKKFEERWWSD